MKPEWKIATRYGTLCSAVLTLLVIAIPGLGWYVSLLLGFPGWLLAWLAVIVFRWHQPADHKILGLLLLTIGNAAFYSWCLWLLLRKAYR